MNYIKLAVISACFLSTSALAENIHSIKLTPENIKKYDENSYIDKQEDLRVISLGSLKDGLKSGCYRVYYFYKSNNLVHQYFKEQPYSWDKIELKYSSTKKNNYDPGACEIISVSKV
ncbi:hypothetical protein [Thalassotalea fusca]